MISLLSYTAAILFLCLISALTIPVIKFMKNKKIEKTVWEHNKPEKITNLGTVNELKVLPLIDFYTSNEDLIGEPGVAYLISADDKKILFDVGFNAKNEHPSPLLKNMNKLGVEVSDIDCVVISHNHIDHIGGIEAKKKNTFSLSGQEIDLKVKAFAPEKMSHATAEIEVIKKPQKLFEGIASIGTIDTAICFMGLTAEQALAVNVKGKGIVLIVGCGHQRIERIIKRTRDLFELPIYGIIGGLHYPVETSRMKCNMQKIIGTGKLPWQRISKTEVKEAIVELDQTNPSIIGISAHDSCDWALNAFKDYFKDRYVDVMVGKEIVI